MSSDIPHPANRHGYIGVIKYVIREDNVKQFLPFRISLYLIVYPQTAVTIKCMITLRKVIDFRPDLNYDNTHFMSIFPINFI